MELKIFNQKAESTGNKKLPKQFDEKVRPYLIKRAVLAFRANNRQPYGASPEAGLRASADLSKKRRKYRGSYGKGISRVPRKIMSRRGVQFNWTAAVIPGVVGGRRAHAPKAEKIWDQKINIKERKKAIRSALAATIDKKTVAERKHIIPDTYPFILSKDLEAVSKLKELRETLVKLGLDKELKRLDKKIVRAGKGKARSRQYKKPRGMLIVTSKYCALSRAGKNIPGVDVKSIRTLNAEDLAPGTHAGRLTLFTESAIDTIQENNLFN